MRIAIYDPEPTSCGLMAWTRGMQDGLRMLGHEADVVSLTWSGRPRVSWGSARPGTMWYDRPLDATGKYRESAAFFRQYDKVILAAPDVGLQDREAQRSGWSLPKYARALEVSGVQFTTALHWYCYSEKYAPFAEAIFSLPGFTGTGISHPVPGMVVQSDAVRKVRWLHVTHPYTPRRQLDDPLPARGTAGTTGRFEHINGFHLTALAAAYGGLPRGTSVILLGATSVSSRASYTLEVYETLRDRFGYAGTRQGSDPFRPHPWELSRDDGTIRYDGAYSDPQAACSRMSVHVSPMALSNSTGVTNYTQLESMDAGCMQVSTRSHWRDSFDGWVCEPLPTMPSMKFLVKDAELQSYVRMLGDLASQALESPDWERSVIARNNREVLRSEHDPRIAARAALEALGE